MEQIGTTKVATTKESSRSGGKDSDGSNVAEYLAFQAGILALNTAILASAGGEAGATYTAAPAGPAEGAPAEPEAISAARQLVPRTRRPSSPEESPAGRLAFHTADLGALGDALESPPGAGRLAAPQVPCNSAQRNSIQRNPVPR
jgi:hypothetical protein